MAAKPWFLYLIECQDGSIYTGITVDVAARYAAHRNGSGARYTRSHPPSSLLAVVEYADRSQASKAEYAMKQLSAAEKRQFVLDWQGRLPGQAGFVPCSAASSLRNVAIGRSGQEQG